jgi:hypothetical protein
MLQQVAYDICYFLMQDVANVFIYIYFVRLSLCSKVALDDLILSCVNTLMLDSLFHGVLVSHFEYCTS